MSREFRRAINNHCIDHIDGPTILTSEMRYLAEEAVKKIPSDRPIFQRLVDDHCECWQSCCEIPDSEFPPNFAMRAMRRLMKMVQEQRKKGTLPDRCHLDHGDDAQATDCTEDHMQYDEVMEHGYFGEKVHCGLCP